MKTLAQFDDDSIHKGKHSNYSFLSKWIFLFHNIVHCHSDIEEKDCIIRRSIETENFFHKKTRFIFRLLCLSNEKNNKSFVVGFGKSENFVHSKKIKLGMNFQWMKNKIVWNENLWSILCGKHRRKSRKSVGVSWGCQHIFGCGGIVEFFTGGHNIQEWNFST